jgi:hypothetical protein
LNIWPTKPSGVQLARPIRPPGRQTPESRKHGIEAGILERQGFGVSHLKRDFQAFGPGPVFAAFQQRGHVVGRSDMATTARGSERRVTVAGGHVEHALIAKQVAGLGELLADNLQSGANDGIVATGPRGHLTVFQGSKINGCTHEFRSVAGWNATRLIRPWWDR